MAATTYEQGPKRGATRRKKAIVIILEKQLLGIAQSLINQGVRLIPVSRDKTPVWSLLPLNEKGKRSWDLLTREPTTMEQVREWFQSPDTTGLAAACGSRSDNLYVFDIDVARFFDKWLGDNSAIFASKRAPCQATGGGGFQMAVKIDGQAPGNLKLAWAHHESELTGRSIAIETRGEGGYIVLPFSLHPSGKHYQPHNCFNGTWGDIPTITQEQLKHLHDTAVATCEAPFTLQELERQENAKNDVKRAKRNMSRPNGQVQSGESVIDRFNNEFRIGDILECSGYTSVTTDRMARPSSKKRSPSVEIRHDLNMSIHYSTNDPLADGKAKTPFNVYCHYTHNGNLKDAVKAASRMLEMDKPPNSKPSEAWEQMPDYWQEQEPPDWHGQHDQISEDQVVTNLPQHQINWLSYEVNDAGNADCFRDAYGNIFRHVSEWGWLTYNGTHWELRDADKRLFALTKNVLRQRVQAALKICDEQKLKSYLFACSPMTKNVRPTLTQIQHDLDLSGHPDTFDAHDFLINVANGTLDLRTGYLTPHDPSQMITHCLDTAYNPDADTSLITVFLSGLGLSEGVIDYLQQASGYTLTGSTREECLFYIFGPTRSGKGTFVSALRSLLGSTLSAEITFDTLTANKSNADAQNFALAPLKPCRLVVASESGKYSALNEAKVKQITGGDSIYCAFKGKTHFNYTPSFKIWLTSNHPPKADVNDDAVWKSRLKLIEFPNSFLGAEDKGLKDALMNDQAYKEALLLWCVQGAFDWYNSERGLSPPAEVIEATQSARDQLDYVRQWLDECTEDDIKSRVTNADLYASYESWCEDNGVNAKKKRSFGRDMSKKGYESQRWYIEKKRVRGYIGLSLA